MTHHLQCSDILFPEQILLILGSQSREHIVRVHNNMHKRVNNSDKSAMTTGEIFGSSPRYHRHHCMVVQMQKGDLPILLPDNEENRIKQFGNLR